MNPISIISVIAYLILLALSYWMAEIYNQEVKVVYTRIPLNPNQDI